MVLYTDIFTKGGMESPADAAAVLKVSAVSVVKTSAVSSSARISGCFLQDMA